MTVTTLIWRFTAALSCTLLAGVLPAHGADTPELVPQIEIGGALLLAPRTDDPQHARHLVPEYQEAFGDRYSTGGVAQWRHPKTGEVLRTVPLAAWPVIETMRIAPVQTGLSPDGSILASRGMENTLRWQNPWTGEILHEWPDEGSPMGFSPDEKYFVSQAGRYRGEDSASEIVVRTTASAEVLHRLQLPYRPTNLVWSQNSSRLATSKVFNRKGTPSVQLNVFEVASGRQIFTTEWDGRFYQARFIPDGSLIAVSQTQQDNAKRPTRDTVEARLWNATGEEQLRQSVVYDGPFSDVKWRFLSDGRLLTSGKKHVPVDTEGSYREERRFHLWDWKSAPRQLSESDAKTEEIAAWKSAVQDATPRVAPGIAPVQKGGAGLARPVFLKHIEVATWRTLVADDSRVWEATTGKLRRAFQPIPPQASAIDISPIAKYFGSAGGGGYGSSGGAFLGIWEFATGKVLWHKSVSLDRSNGIQFSEAGTGWTTSLHFSPNGSRVAIGSAMEQPPLAVYDVCTGKQQWELPFNWKERVPVRNVAWSPNGSEIAATISTWGSDALSLTGHIRFYDGATGKQVREWKSSPAGTLAWSPDSRTIAIEISRGEVLNYGGFRELVPNEIVVQLRDVATGDTKHELRGARDTIAALHFSPDGTRLAGAARDGAIRVWNVQDGTLLHTLDDPLHGHAGNVRDVAWIGNDRVASVGDYGTVKFWNVLNGQLAATALLLQRPTQTGAARAWRDQRRKGFGGGDFVQLPPTDWLIYTPGGYYDASPGAEKFIRWRVGDQLFPAAKYKAQFHQPLKVRAALHG